MHVPINTTSHHPHLRMNHMHVPINTHPTTLTHRPTNTHPTDHPPTRRSDGREGAGCRVDLCGWNSNVGRPARGARGADGAAPGCRRRVGGPRVCVRAVRACHSQEGDLSWVGVKHEGIVRDIHPCSSSPLLFVCLFFCQVSLQSMKHIEAVM